MPSMHPAGSSGEAPPRGVGSRARSTLGHFGLTAWLAAALLAGVSPANVGAAPVASGGEAAPASAGDEARIRVVTSILPLAMLVEEMAGRRVEVRSLLPPGADAHSWEPRPADAVAVAEARIVVMLGSSIDRWMSGALAPGPGAVVVRLDDEAGHDHGQDHDHAGAEEDPHAWLDPLWVREHALRPLQRALSEALPAAAPQIGATARSMAERMSDLDDDIREGLVDAATKAYFAWHPGWGRFAARYALHDTGVAVEGEAREPSLGRMAAAVRAARDAGVMAVLVESQGTARGASVMAEELGVPVVAVDAFGDPASVDRCTYGGLMRFNGRAFARALGVPEDEDEDEDDGDGGEGDGRAAAGHRPAAD